MNHIFRATAFSGARLRPVPIDRCGNFAAEINDIFAAGGEAHRVFVAVENGAVAGSTEAMLTALDIVIAEAQDAKRKLAKGGMKVRRGTQLEIKAYSTPVRFWTAAIRKQRRVVA